MARKSRWQQFSENFNATYDTFNGAFEKYETSKMMKQDFKDDAGNALEGSGLDRARYEALAAIKTKYGDAEGGLNLRTKAAGLEAQNYSNDVNIAIKPYEIEQKGIGASALQRAQTSSANAGAANSYANANATNVLLPGRVVGQGLGNQSLGLDVRYKGDTLNDRVIQQSYETDLAGSNSRKGTVDANVAERTEDAQVTSAEAGAVNDTAIAADNQVTAQIAQATQQETVDKQLKELKALAAEAQGKALTADAQNAADFVMSEIVAEGATMVFDTPGEKQTWTSEQILAANIDPRLKLPMVTSLNNLGIEAIEAEAVKITTAITNAWQKGGRPAAVSAYNDIDDGLVMTDKVLENGDIQLIATDEKGNSTVQFTTNGPNPDAQIGEFIMAQATNPTKALTVGAAQLTRKQAQADLDKTKSETGLRGEQTKETVANTELLRNRAEQIVVEIDAIKDPATKASKVQAKIADYISSEAYSNAMADDPKKALATRAQLESALGIEIVPPTGFPLEAWYEQGLSGIDHVKIFEGWPNMSAEEKQKFLEQLQ